MSHVWERRSKADLAALRVITRIRRIKLEFLAMRADCWHDVGRELAGTSLFCDKGRVNNSGHVELVQVFDTSTTEILVQYAYSETDN